MIRWQNQSMGYDTMIKLNSSADSCSSSKKIKSKYFLSAMEEKILWEGKPSQWTNFGYYIFCAILSVVGIGLLMAIWRYIQTNCHSYEVTDQRIIEKSGVFSRTTDELELYRVRDVRQEQPFFLRLVGLSNILLATSDRTHGTVIMRGVPKGESLRKKIRIAVEARRDKKRVREVDIE